MNAIEAHEAQGKIVLLCGEKFGDLAQLLEVRLDKGIDIDNETFLEWCGFSRFGEPEVVYPDGESGDPAWLLDRTATDFQKFVDDCVKNILTSSRKCVS